MAVDSVQNQMDCDDLKLKTNKKSEKAEITKKITNGERSSVLVRHPMASKESVEHHASLSRLFVLSNLLNIYPGNPQSCGRLVIVIKYSLEIFNLDLERIKTKA